MKTHHETHMSVVKGGTMNVDEGTKGKSISQDVVSNNCVNILITFMGLEPLSSKTYNNPHIIQFHQHDVP
jgi:hypothetical protein